MVAIEFVRQVEAIFEKYLYRQHTAANVSAINAEITGIVLGLRNEGCIAHGPTIGGISLRDAPLDVLPFAPFALNLPYVGRYRVYQDGEMVGYVDYDGLPTQEPGVCSAGVSTTFTPKEAVNQLRLKLEVGQQNPVPEPIFCLRPDEQAEMNRADFTIISAPEKIRLTCPHCGEDIDIPWGEVDKPECWSDDWPNVECPECGKEIELGRWDYD